MLHTKEKGKKKKKRGRGPVGVKYHHHKNINEKTMICLAFHKPLIKKLISNYKPKLKPIFEAY